MVSKTFTVGTAMLVLAISLGSLGLVEAVNVRTSRKYSSTYYCVLAQSSSLGLEGKSSASNYRF